MKVIAYYALKEHVASLPLVELSLTHIAMETAVLGFGANLIASNKMKPPLSERAFPHEKFVCKIVAAPFNIPSFVLLDTSRTL